MPTRTLATAAPLAPLAALAALALAAGCTGSDGGGGGGDDDDAPPVDAAPIGDPDPQLPPQGAAALAAWLAAGPYLAWACEPAPHPARPPGAHGENRICSNALLSATADGPYPVGAAAVKELHRGGQITGYAVGIKVAAASAPSSWYWYEAFGSSVVADGVGRALCSNCHAGADRDFVFTRVPPP